jgi:hypothetical protein
MTKYPTSDGHEFVKEKDAIEWQSAIDYNDKLRPVAEDYGLGQIKLKISTLTEAIILRKYLTFYLGFDIEQVEKIPINIDEGSIVVLFDRSTKEVEVIW